MNGGFVSMGGAHLSPFDMVRTVGEEETRRYWASQSEAVDLVKSIVAEGGNACDLTGDGNLCVAHHPREMQTLSKEAEILRDCFGVRAEFMEQSRFRAEVHGGPESYGALVLKPGFGIHPMKYVRTLAGGAAKAGAKIHTGVEILSIRKDGANYRLETSCSVSVCARKILIATNGYTPHSLHPDLELRALPVISSILVTEPYSAADLDTRGFRSTTPIYNTRHVLSYYRRLPDGRVLFGGRGDTNGTLEAAAHQTQAALLRLKRILPGFDDARIAYSWRGLVCLTRRRTASIGLLPGDPNIGFAFGCQGSGIATMTWAGALIADLLAGKKSEDDVPALLRGLPGKLPPSPHLIRMLVRAAYAVYALRDRFNV
jgi:glycine/D-amino acid oxidase-like deaminating enzyme